MVWEVRKDQGAPCSLKSERFSVHKALCEMRKRLETPAQELADVDPSGCKGTERFMQTRWGEGWREAVGSEKKVATLHQHSKLSVCHGTAQV